ncbi:MAG: glycosyltransferase family 39 protein [Anaerolineae bacterium]|nr:glycosyltransferase family 39 protein [Anaerolineae bacterium]
MAASATRSIARATLIAIVVILLFAMLIRVYNLQKESFWEDEGWTMLLIKGQSPADIVINMANDQHPPLYFLLLHYWVEITGNSEFAVRLPSAFASLIGVALIFRLAADLFGARVGSLAALVLALTDNDVMLAQDARHYALMSMFVIASTLFYLRYLKNPTRRNGVAWLLASVALMYTHYLGVFVLIVQALHALIFARPLSRLAGIMLRLVLIGVAWLPWAYVFVGQSLVRYQRPIIYQSTLPNTPETFALVRGDLIGYQWGLTGGLLLLGFIYIAYHHGKARYSLRPLRPIVYLALWLVLPIIAIVVINIRFPILTTRNFLIVTPAIAILIGHGISNLDRTAQRFALAAFVIMSLLTVDAYLLKPPWREVAQDIVQYRSDDEPVLMNVWTGDFALRYHIGRDLGVDPVTLPLISMPEWREKYGEQLFAQLLRYLESKPTIWVATWGDGRDGLLEFLTTHGYQRTAIQRELHRNEEIFVYRYDLIDADTVPLAHFSDVMALVQGKTVIQDKSLRIDLLWQVLNKPFFDYSVSVFLLDSTNTVVAQNDAAPLNGHALTTTWQPGEIYFDSHNLRLPATLPVGDYVVGVKVYWYGDLQPLPVDGTQYFELEHLKLP